MPPLPREHHPAASAPTTAPPTRPAASTVASLDAARPRHVFRRRFRHRRPRLARLASVWPCADISADGSAHGGTGLVAGWLLDAIVKIVTGYTQPGDRVLLLSAPLPSETAPPGRNGMPHWAQPLAPAGLSEAGWTVARLGRSIRSWTAGPPPDATLGAATGTTTGSTGPAPERFDLVITVVDPQTTGWVTTMRWGRMLTPQGTLATITHSHHRDGVLRDPISTLVTTFRNHGLGWLDHIILLDSAAHDSAAAGSATRAPAASPHGARSGSHTVRWQPTRHIRVHHDLLLLINTGRRGPRD